MFGSKKTITDRVKDSLTGYLDEKFDDYRGQIASDLSRGLAALAGLVAVWSVVVISTIFLAISLAILIGWLLSFAMPSGSYAVSFSLMSIVIFASTYFLIKNKEHYIEKPVFNIMSELLRSPTVLVDKDIPITEEPVNIEQLPPTDNNSVKTKSPPISTQKENESKKKL